MGPTQKWLSENSFQRQSENLSIDRNDFSSASLCGCHWPCIAVSRKQAYGAFTGI